MAFSYILSSFLFNPSPLFCESSQIFCRKIYFCGLTRPSPSFPPLSFLTFFVPPIVRSRSVAGRHSLPFLSTHPPFAFPHLRILLRDFLSARFFLERRICLLFCTARPDDEPPPWKPSMGFIHRGPFPSRRSLTPFLWLLSSAYRGRPYS